ncbi:MAG TPA: helix-turn-helix domain-containing protein [Gaiellales bacterium]|nr:helix-turn-helix domain-containing protein [Gaiellales bacterium]
MFEIGPSLQEARERRGLAFAQVEADTAIRGKYIRALEQEQFDVLPGPTYAKGFLRAYAEYLGLDGQLFVDEFNSRHHDPRREGDRPIYPNPRSRPQQRRRQRRESNVVMVVLAAIVAVSALIFLALRFPPSQPQAPPVTPSTPTTHPPTTTPPPTTSSTSTGKQNQAKATSFTVALTSTGCWLQVHRVSPTGPPAVTTQGTPLGDGYNLQSTITIRSRKPIVLTDIGAPGSLTVAVDGRPVTLPTGTNSSSVVRITHNTIS